MTPDALTVLVRRVKEREEARNRCIQPIQRLISVLNPLCDLHAARLDALQSSMSQILQDIQRDGDLLDNTPSTSEAQETIIEVPIEEESEKNKPSDDDDDDDDALSRLGSWATAETTLTARHPLLKSVSDFLLPIQTWCRSPGGGIAVMDLTLGCLDRPRELALAQSRTTRWLQDVFCFAAIFLSCLFVSL